MTICIKERVYDDGEWIITEKITLVVGKDIDTYTGSGYTWDPNNPFDTGWIYTTDQETKYRTYIMGLSTDCETSDCCLEET